MMKTYKGSCHCGAMKYEADIDLAQGTGRCNCTYCLKTRAWAATIKPTHFRLTSDSARGVAYRGHSQAPVKFHCGNCGVHTHAEGDAEYMGGAFVQIFVATLDDASSDDLMNGPIRYSDGLNNNWTNPPSDIRHL